MPHAIPDVMSEKKKDDRQEPDPIVDLERSRDRLQGRRQDRAAAELAARFHDAMGWKGKPATKSAGKKSKRKKKR